MGKRCPFNLIIKRIFIIIIFKLLPLYYIELLRPCHEQVLLFSNNYVLVKKIINKFIKIEDFSN